MTLEYLDLVVAIVDSLRLGVVLEAHFAKQRFEFQKNIYDPIFTPGLTYDVNIPKLWVQF